MARSADTQTLLEEKETTVDHDQIAHEIHLPPPSIRPIIMAFGITLFAAGLVTTYWLLLIGFITFLFGLGGWIYDDIQEARNEQHHH